MDGSTTWERLTEMKKANPLLVAQYAQENNLISFPAFAWWVPVTLKKKNRIMSKVAARNSRTTHKYGIKVPKTIPYRLSS